MDTPGSEAALETVTTALDLGITFIDTAREYAGSEHLLGEAVRARSREGMFIASKTFSRTASGSQYDVDRSLRTLGVECVDLYQLHDVSSFEAWAAVEGDGGALEGLRTARYRGLIGHIGVSSHDLDVLHAIILSGECDTVMVEYSAFYPGSAEVIALAQAHDIGVIAMRPVGGSGRTSVMRRRMAEGTAGILTPANLLRYVLSHAGVSVVIPGARYPDRVRANAATAVAFEPLEEAEQRALEEAAAALY